MRIARLVGIFVFAFAVTALSQTPSSKIELARQLGKLLQLDEMFKDDIEECKTAHDAEAAALAAYKSYPESFEGITPSSEHRLLP